MKFLASLLSSTPDTTQLKSLITNITNVVTAVLGIVSIGIIVLAVLLAFKFFTADDDGKRKNAKAQLIYAIIGLVVMIALMIMAPVIKNVINGLATNA